MQVSRSWPATRTRWDAVVAGLSTTNNQHHQSVVSDFSKPDEVGKQFQRWLDDHPAQILINNSGGPPPGPIVDADGEAFLNGMRAHLLCNQALVRSTLPGMRQSSFGRIVNIISTSVYEPIPGLGVSNTVRAAVAAWAKTLSAELAPEGITVNNVLPGFTATDRLDSLIKGRADKAGVSNERIAEGMRTSVPMGRFARAEEIASAVAFLASPARVLHYRRQPGCGWRSPEITVKQLGNFIGGRFQPASSGAFLDDIEPATGSVIAHLPDSDAADVAQAVAAAKSGLLPAGPTRPWPSGPRYWNDWPS